MQGAGHVMAVAAGVLGGAGGRLCRRPGGAEVEPDKVGLNDVVVAQQNLASMCDTNLLALLLS